MLNGIDDMQKASKDNTDRVMQSFEAVSKGMQAIAVEVSDYSKASFEEGSAAMEKVVSAKSLDKAVEAQSEYVRSAYESFFTRMSKIGEMYAEVARDAYKPYEGMVAKAGR